MSMKLIALRIRVAQAIEARREAGQGSLEYIGAILVAGAIVAIVLAAACQVDIGTALSDAVKKVTGGK